MSANVTAPASTSWRARLDPRARWRDVRDRSWRILRTYRMILAGERRRARLFFALILLDAAVPVAQLWLTREIVNALVAGDSDRALLGGVISALLVALFAIARPFQQVLATRIQDRGVANVEKALIRAGSRVRDLVPFTRPAYRDRMSAVRQSGWSFGVAIVMAGQWYPGAFSLVGIMISLAFLHPLIPVALIACGLIEHLTWKRQFDLEYKGLFEVARTGSKMMYARDVAAAPQHAAEVRMFGIGPWLRERYRRLAGETLVELNARRREGAIWATVGTSFQMIALAGSFLYIARRAEGGSLAIGDLALFIFALVQAQGLTRSFYVTMETLHEMGVRSKDFFDFIDGARAEVAIPAPGEGALPAAEPASGVALRNVSFTYPNSGRPILHDLSLDLPAGTVTALVGENGAGKSTLVNLLSRMFDPDAGTITLDGVPFARHDLTTLRNRITVVYQDAARFAFTLEDNIAIGTPAFTWGNPDAGRDRARRVGDRIGIGAIAEGLPKGYGTGLTRTFDDSVDLSGWQWQLVAFGRGLIREDAALAMLDEPSSALDPVREAEQIEHIRAFARARRRSVLLISHRLSTVRWADRIAVMEGGAITECGSHADLVAKGGVYADLFRMQASRYRDADA